MITQEIVDIECKKAQDIYAAMDQKEAGLKFAYELQGFVACEVTRGVPLERVLEHIYDLINLLIKVQDEDDTL